MAYETYRGGLGLTLRQAEKQSKLAVEALAAERRITEAEVAQKEASKETSALTERILSWVPAVAGVAAVGLGAFLFFRRKKNPPGHRRSARRGRRPRRR
jgi:LPXTG-motif cell wall-anchored protein